MLEINTEEAEGYTLIRPSGELDAYTVGTFRETLARLAEGGDLLIDLSQVSFMDSAGLGALIGGIRLSREAEHAVAVACNRPVLVRLLHTTGFDRIVPVSESVEEAEEALLAEPDE
ncbi:MAG: STAS domain-containing protein [Acidimicrobiales bacterium]|nr:STAS domain-containing protein [Acidimicrobiales bacterium]